MLGVDRSRVPERILELGKEKNPTTGIALADEADIMVWGWKLMLEGCNTTCMVKDSEITAMVEKEIRKLKGDELRMVMTFLTGLFVDKVIQHAKHAQKVMDLAAGGMEDDNR